jgi:hypothetical protein
MLVLHFLLAHLALVAHLAVSDLSPGGKSVVRNAYHEGPEWNNVRAVQDFMHDHRPPSERTMYFNMRGG